LASVGPPAFNARACQEYWVPGLSPLTAALGMLPVDTQLPSQLKLCVVSMQYS
jgi:hypothetical protein